MQQASGFFIKRIYEPPAASDGLRVLVDRLWPRGVSKADARLDLWLKEVAPSTALRRWLHSDPSRWQEFAKRYEQELAQQPEALAQLRRTAQRGAVTLLSAVKDIPHSHVPVLLAHLQD